MQPVPKAPVGPKPHVVKIDYTNWEGKRSIRRILPGDLFFGKNEWHPEPCWMVHGYDVEREVHRTFLMSGIHSWVDEPGEYPQP